VQSQPSRADDVKRAIGLALFQRVEAAAKRKGIGVGAFVVAAVERHLADEGRAK
jgi:hypothetical protein